MMANVTDSKERYQLQDWRYIKASIRTRTSVWIGLAAIVGWLLRIFLLRSEELSRTGVITTQIIIQRRSRWLPGKIHRKAEVGCCHWPWNFWSGCDQIDATLFQDLEHYTYSGAQRPGASDFRRSCRQDSSQGFSSPVRVRNIIREG